MYPHPDSIAVDVELIEADDVIHSHRFQVYKVVSEVTVWASQVSVKYSDDTYEEFERGEVVYS